MKIYKLAGIFLSVKIKQFFLIRENIIYAMEVGALLAAVIAALLTTVLFIFVTYTVYLVIVQRRYAHIPSPKGAS